MEYCLGRVHHAFMNHNHRAFGDLPGLNYLPFAASSTNVIVAVSSTGTFVEASKSLEKLIINQTLGRTRAG